MGKQMDAAHHAGRTLFPNTVVPPGPAKKHGLRVLKSAEANRKIGGWMMKGRWRGMPVFSLTLEERRTCPKDCANWTRCYGDNMHLAKRYQHGPLLEAALLEDLAVLDRTYRFGYVVRLHVLGDFYSTDYVYFWRRQLADRLQLHVFGYTHWQHDTEIGQLVAETVQDYGERCSVLRSDRRCADDPLPAAMTVGVGEPIPTGTVHCPVESKRTVSCGTCGLCMNGTTSVTFVDHGKEVNTARINEIRRLKRALPVV